MKNILPGLLVLIFFGASQPLYAAQSLTLGLYPYVPRLEQFKLAISQA